MHFTRASRVGDALDNLTTILRDQLIRASSRMVVDGRPVVCLFDGPLGELRGLLTPENEHRYQPFGVAIERRYAFERGVRPAIYLPLAEARQLLPESELWRVVTIDLMRVPPIDWTFEREWRVMGDLPLPAQGVVALVESWRDVAEIYDRFDGAPPCAGVLPLDPLFGHSR
jgi:hypothetical protein